MNKTLNKEHGATLVVVAMVMFILLGFTALAVDIGYYFVIKNRLQNAVDAAALAGVDTIYRSNNLNNFPADFTANAQTAANNALSLDGYPSTDPNITSTAIEVGWWDTDPQITPSGYYHYPAVQVSMTYNTSVFFAKIFNILNLGANVTATAVTEVPGKIFPILPFAISYCTVYDRWLPPSPPSFPGGPISGTAAEFAISSAYSPGSFDPLISCIASNLAGTVNSGATTQTVTGPNNDPKQFKKLSVDAALKDDLGYFKPNTSITSVVNGTPNTSGICLSLDCTYSINSAPTNTITAPNTITAESGVLANWTPLVYSTTGVGASVLESYIPGSKSQTSPPGVSIGQEIRIQTGTTDSLFQSVEDCVANNTCDLVALPVVNGLPCTGGLTNCPATSASDPNFPLTNVPIAPNGIAANTNLPIIGFTCVRITAVDHTGSPKQIKAKLDTGCVISGKGGGLVYYGVLLPPVLVH